jgi:hypothetical protein
VLVEVLTFGFRQNQFLIGLYGNIAVTVVGPAPEFQFQNGSLFLVGRGIQQGGLQMDA